MKMKVTLAVLFFALLAGCKKESTIDNKPPETSNTDTTKILTLVEYFYHDTDDGDAGDSTIRTLIKTTVNGETKYIITKIYSAYPGDTSWAVYKLNAQNQLLDVKYTEKSDPDSYDHYIYTWTGDNITKIDYGYGGTIERTYNFNYSSAGNNTEITLTENPPANSDTLFHDNQPQYYSDLKSALFVSTADFKPVGYEIVTYYYLRNEPSRPPTISRDTGYARFVFSATGDLQQEIMASLRIDTNANDFNPTIVNYKDSLVYDYTRDNNINEDLSNVLNNLYGNRILALSYVYGHTGNYLPDYLSADGYDNGFFTNHPLNKISHTDFKWRNGEPDTDPYNGQPIDDYWFKNTFDNQNRLIKSVRYMGGSTNDAVSGFRIIWP